jgi:enoyl-CoA hydratase/carnithine racemase
VADGSVEQLTTSDIVVTTGPPGVAIVTLHRPARRNAVTLAMWRELSAVFARFGDDPAVRVAILTGRGEHFCAGADIGEFGAARRDAAEVSAYERDVDGATEAIMNLGKPTIAAVSGFCLGGGCALAMACDFRVAHGSARFGIPAARLGTVYGTLDSRNLLALVGLPRAKAILFGGHQFDAEEAFRIGFVDHVVNEPILDAAQDFAARFAENAPLSIAAAKLILNALVKGDTDARARDIERAIEHAAESTDYREGVRAFMEKRRPRFTGR